MAMPLTYRPVQPAECRQVAELHRQVFPPEQVALTLFASARVEHYLANLIAFPQYQSEHLLLGAWQQTQLAGYAHCRALPQAWHLNHIAIAPALRGQAIGRTLWEHFVGAGRERGFRQVSLDVVAENAWAVAWYQRRGLAAVRTTRWYACDLAPGPVPPAASVQLLDWEAAQAWQAAYGFSTFRLAVRGAVWTVGRLGERYFRVTQPCPAETQAVLAHLDPARRLLLAAEQPPAESGCQEVSVSLRMEGPL